MPLPIKRQPGVSPQTVLILLGVGCIGAGLVGLSFAVLAMVGA